MQIHTNFNPLKINMAEHNEIGHHGEDIATKWLQDNGFEVIERNWRCGHLELDIVCAKDGLIVVVEVKSRTGDFGNVDELLDYKKRRNILRAGAAWLKRHKLECELRFDLIVVESSTGAVSHYPEAISVCD